MKTFFNIVVLSLCAVLVSCGNPKPQKTPVQLPSQGGKRSERSIIKVPYTEMGNVKVIPVKLNGQPMNMIFDTGCSGIHISLHELQTLWKNGQFEESDIIGSSYSQIADGSIVENAIVNLKKLQIGDYVCYNIEASISEHEEAPLLLGNGALKEVESFSIDDNAGVIKFYLK